MRALHLLPLLFGLAAFPATAGEAQMVEPANPVAGHAVLTYFDLVGLLMPDARHDGTDVVGTPRSTRHIVPDYTSDEPPAEVRFSHLDALPIVSGGRERLLLLIDFGGTGGEGKALLALYGFDAGTPALLDAADVSLDRDTGFHEQALLKLGTGESAVVTVSTHHNSSQGYAAFALTLVRDDRLELVDDIWTLSDRACAFERDEVTSFAAKPAASGAFGDMQAVVTETVKPSDEDCGEEAKPAASTQSFEVTYRWNGSAYVPQSDAFERLQAINEERY